MNPCAHVYRETATQDVECVKCKTCWLRLDCSMARSGVPLALVTLAELLDLVDVIQHFADRHFGSPESTCEAKLRKVIKPFESVAGRRPRPDA